MEIKEMTMLDIESRKKEISALLETEGADLEALNKEVDELNERASAIKEQAETRKAIIEKVANNEGATTIIEERKGDEKMEKRFFDVDTVEYRNYWINKIKGTPIEERQNETYATTDNGNAIPTMVADKFIEKMKAIAPMLDEIQLFRVAGNLKVTVEGTNNPASAHTENATISASADTVVNVSLGVVEYAKIIKISKSVRAMSVDAFEGWLVDLLSRDIARAIDNHIINHTTNGITHGTYTTGTNQIVSTVAYKYKDLCDLVALLPAGYDADAKFLVNKKTLWGDIKGIVDDAKRPIFDATTKTLLGYPVLVDDYVPTDDKGVYLASWKEAVIGNLSTPVEVEASEIAGFSTGSIDFRGFAGFDSKPVNDGANIYRLIRS